jgi:DNA-binding MarR family transcriptional regulator
MKRETTRQSEPASRSEGQARYRGCAGAALVPRPGRARRVAAEHDLSIIQTRLLGVLRDRSPGMNELARYLELDKSSVTGLVDRAEQRGLVRRKASAADRRAIEVSITAAGRKIAQRVEAEFEQRDRLARTDLDGDRARGACPNWQAASWSKTREKTASS